MEMYWRMKNIVIFVLCVIRSLSFRFEDLGWNVGTLSRERSLYYREGGGGGEEEGPRFNLSYPLRLCDILIIRLY